MYYPCPNCRYQIECKARKSNVMYSATCPVCGEASRYMITFASGNDTSKSVIIRRQERPTRTPVERVYQDAFGDGELEL